MLKRKDMEENNFDVYALEKRYLKLTERKYEIERELNEINNQFLNESKRTGELKFLGESKVFSIVGEKTQLRFDTKTFKKDHSDLYEKYVKTVNVSAYMKATDVIRDHETGKALYEDI